MSESRLFPIVLKDGSSLRVRVGTDEFGAHITIERIGDDDVAETIGGLAVDFDLDGEAIRYSVDNGADCLAVWRQHKDGWKEMSADMDWQDAEGWGGEVPE